MSPVMGAKVCIASPVAAVAAGMEFLTNQMAGTTMYLTTPSTPLNDAHQGGYFLWATAIPRQALGAGA